MHARQAAAVQCMAWQARLTPVLAAQAALQPHKVAEAADHLRLRPVPRRPAAGDDLVGHVRLRRGVPGMGWAGRERETPALVGKRREEAVALPPPKKVEEMEPSKEDMTIEAGKNKVFTLNELRIKIEKDYGNMPWGKRMFEDLFRWL